MIIQCISSAVVIKNWVCLSLSGPALPWPWHAPILLALLWPFLSSAEQIYSGFACPWAAWTCPGTSITLSLRLPCSYLTPEMSLNCACAHGLSEGHFMLKRHDICRSITDVELIPKMFFWTKSVDGLFQKRVFRVRHDIFFIGGLASPCFK